VTNDEGAYSGTHPGTTTVGGRAVTVSDNGDQVYVVRNTFDTTFTSKLSVVDLPTGRITAVPIHGAPNALAVSGNRIYVAGRDTSVVHTDAANDPPRVTVIQIDDDLFQVDIDDRDGDRVTLEMANFGTPPTKGGVVTKTVAVPAMRR
jgi:hypothetical protein